VTRVLVVDRNPRCRAEMVRLLREVGYEVLTTDGHKRTQAPDLDAAEFVVVRRELDDFDDVASVGELRPDETDVVISWLRPSGVVGRGRMAAALDAANRQATRILEAITPALRHRDMRRMAAGLRVLQSKIWGKTS
jgi:hypothetical protein